MEKYLPILWTIAGLIFAIRLDEIFYKNSNFDRIPNIDIKNSYCSFQDHLVYPNSHNSKPQKEKPTNFF